MIKNHDYTNDFYINRQLIGEGKMAKVYMWEGFAYKCFQESYPQDWLEYEMHIQNTVHRSLLNTVAYYPCEIPNTIKMDLINGTALADRIRKEKYKDGVEDLITLFKDVHTVRGLDLPKLVPYLIDLLPKVPVEDVHKQKALMYISELPDDEVLCHLDFHFLNLMFTTRGYTIIDWVNAKLGHPIYDFARSYVILYEHAYRMSQKFLKLVQKSSMFNENDLYKAIYVMALHRLTEFDSEKVKQLIDEMIQKSLT